MTKYHVPDNEQMMDEIYVALSMDENGEGIVSFMTDCGSMPIVFGHKRMLDQIRDTLKRISLEAGTKIRIVKFNKIEILEEFDGSN